MIKSYELLEVFENSAKIKIPRKNIINEDYRRVITIIIDGIGECLFSITEVTEKFAVGIIHN